MTVDRPEYQHLSVCDVVRTRANSQSVWRWQRRDITQHRASASRQKHGHLRGTATQGTAAAGCLATLHRGNQEAYLESTVVQKIQAQWCQILQGHWSNPPFLVFWHSGTQDWAPECQNVTKLKGWLDQYGAEHFGRLIFATVRKSVGLTASLTFSTIVNDSLSVVLQVSVVW